ncbi:unnamed protein product, partial [Iphiclides podalirius]
MANLTLRYLDELSYVLNSRRHLASQAKASSVGDLLNPEEDRFPTSVDGLLYFRWQYTRFVCDPLYRGYGLLALGSSFFVIKLRAVFSPSFQNVIHLR